jgi:hypothetical protein
VAVVYALRACAADRGRPRAASRAGRRAAGRSTFGDAVVGRGPGLGRYGLVRCASDGVRCSDVARWHALARRSVTTAATAAAATAATSCRCLCWRVVASCAVSQLRLLLQAWRECRGPPARHGHCTALHGYFLGFVVRNSHIPPLDRCQYVLPGGQDRTVPHWACTSTVEPPMQWQLGGSRGPCRARGGRDPGVGAGAGGAGSGCMRQQPQQRGQQQQPPEALSAGIEIMVISTGDNRCQA